MDIEDIFTEKTEYLKNVDLIKLKKYILKLIEINPKNFKEFDDACIIIRRQVKICPKKAQIIHYYRKLVEDKEIHHDLSLEKLMIKKLVRGTSGVEVVTILTSPFPSWTENGEKKIQKFSCGQNCGYCPKENQVDLNCIILNINVEEKASKITLKSDNPTDEVRVITYITLDSNEIVYCFKQSNFNDQNRTLKDDLNTEVMKQGKTSIEDVKEDNSIAFDLKLNKKVTVRSELS